MKSEIGVRRGPIQYELRRGHLSDEALNHLRIGLCRSFNVGTAIGAQLKRIVKERSSPARGLLLHNNQRISCIDSGIEFVPHNMALQLTAWGQLDRYALLYERNGPLSAARQLSLSLGVAEGLKYANQIGSS